MRDLHGRPLLGHVLARVCMACKGQAAVIATSDRPVDDPIAAFATQAGARLFRGSSDDVASRAFDCAENFGFERIVRVSGDSPFIDPTLIVEMVTRAEASPTDIVTNVFPRTYPPGMSVEVIDTSALGGALSDMDVEDREHVTRYFYRNPGRFRIQNVASPDPRLAEVSLTVDTPADLEKAAWILSRLGPHPERASLEQVVQLARAWAARPTPVVEDASGI